MISALNSANKPTFTSIVPVRIFIDGMETCDEKLIKTSCRQLGNILVGPSKSENQLSIMRKFDYYDKDYNIQAAVKGLPKQKHHKNVHPSDYFRSIIENGRTFLFTGPQASIINSLGKQIGSEKIASKENGILNSFDLFVAKKNYSRAISNFISNPRLRMTKLNQDGKRNPLTLNINMKSNKKYGLSTFKIKLEDINFE